MRTPSTTFLLLLVLALLFATTSVSAGDFLSDKNCPTGSVFVWTGIKADPGKQCGDPWSQAYACINEGKPVKKGRYAFPGRNEELCTPKPPLRYTLLSTQGNSTVAAGTKDVMVASVQLIADAANAEPVLVRGVSGIFEGDATAIAACALLADGVVLMDGFALTAGTATMPFRTPVEVSPGVSVSLTVTCTIHSDAAGKTYRWGLVEHQDAVRMGQDVFPPEIAIARRPDGRAGSNGVTMTVVPNSITLDHVTYHDILLPPQGSTVAPGTALTAQLEVTNDGGVPWEAGAYELHPRTEVTKAWMAGGRTAIPLPERTLPGASATFPLSLVAPAATVPSSYELSWYLVRLADGRQLIQPSTFPELALMVNPVSPKPTLLETLISTFAPPVAITPSGPVPTDTGSEGMVVPTAPPPVPPLAAEEPTGTQTKQVVQESLPLPSTEDVLDPVSAVKVLLKNLLPTITPRPGETPTSTPATTTAGTIGTTTGVSGVPPAPVSTARTVTDLTPREREPFERDLQLYWQFEDNGISKDGQTIYDRSGHNNSATIVSIGLHPPRVTDKGRFGRGLEFLGTESYLNVSNINIPEPLSLSVWLKAASPTDAEALFTGACKQDGHIAFDLPHDGAFHHVAWLAKLDPSQIFIPDGEMQRDIQEVYIDGKLFLGPSNNCDYASYIGIKGDLATLSFGYFEGTIDEVRVYGRWLTAAELQVLADPTRQTPVTIALRERVPQRVTVARPSSFLASLACSYLALFGWPGPLTCN